MSRPAAVLLPLLVVAGAARAQHPLRHFTDAVEIRYARSQPVVAYTLRVDSADLSGYAVEMRIRNAPDTLRLAMAVHPEYDDRFYRYVEGLSVETRGGSGAVTRLDSTLWRAGAPGGEAVVRYRVHLPPGRPDRRQAWVPFLSPSGGLVGGPHSFMYLAGETLAPAHLTLELPAGWDAATGLEPTSDPRVFFAPSADVLMDSPILIGRFRSWRFAVDGVPHRVVYWPLPDAAPFDTAAFVGGVEKLVRQAVAVFGRAPWREYTFLFQDGGFAALEHRNSVTIGAPSGDLARNPAGYFAETAHEFFHAWNLMRIRPAEYRGVDYRPQPPTAGLWFSEGLSMFYADLLLRRAGLPVSDSTRAAHLERLIGSYLASSGNAHFSAEAVSRVAYNAEPGALGDYDASTHLQGELIGDMLDLTIRDATAGRRSMDDVMRVMLERYSGERGFTGADVERVVAELCACPVKPFFDAYVRGAAPIAFDRFLAPIGLRVRLTRGPALGNDGRPIIDFRLRAWLPPGDSALRLVVAGPESVWGRAGLHTGDRLIAMNGAPVPTASDFRALLGRLTVGDTVRVDVARGTGRFTARVVMTPRERPFAHLEEIPGAGARQRALRDKWLTGAP
jgi:predicted metalloprotease with PDZ domain